MAAGGDAALTAARLRAVVVHLRIMQSGISLGPGAIEGSADAAGAAMTEDHCRRRAEHLIGMMAKAQHVEERRRLIDEAMRWHNCAMVARERELGSAAFRL